MCDDHTKNLPRRPIGGQSRDVKRGFSFSVTGESETHGRSQEAFHRQAGRHGRLLQNCPGMEMRTYSTRGSRASMLFYALFLQLCDDDVVMHICPVLIFDMHIAGEFLAQLPCCVAVSHAPASFYCSREHGA